MVIHFLFPRSHFIQFKTHEKRGKNGYSALVQKDPPKDSCAYSYNGCLHYASSHAKDYCDQIFSLASDVCDQAITRTLDYGLPIGSVSRILAPIRLARSRNFDASIFLSLIRIIYVFLSFCAPLQQDYVSKG